MYAKIVIVKLIIFGLCAYILGMFFIPLLSMLLAEDLFLYVSYLSKINDILYSPLISAIL